MTSLLGRGWPTPILLPREINPRSTVQESQVAQQAMISDFLIPQREEEKETENGETVRWGVREELMISAARRGLCSLLCVFSCILGRRCDSHAVDWNVVLLGAETGGCITYLVDDRLGGSLHRGHPWYPMSKVITDLTPATTQTREKSIELDPDASHRHDSLSSLPIGSKALSKHIRTRDTVVSRSIPRASVDIITRPLKGESSQLLTIDAASP